MLVFINTHKILVYILIYFFFHEVKSYNIIFNIINIIFNIISLIG